MHKSRSHKSGDEMEKKFEKFMEIVTHVAVSFLLSAVVAVVTVVIMNYAGIKAIEIQTQTFQKEAHKNHEALWKAIGELRKNGVNTGN